MGISKIFVGVAGTAFALTLGSAAFADLDIKNADDCAFEGGSMVNVKGSDYCLVQIRPEEYSGAEYDGNQLGVVDCPGDKLNDGVFCMYPVTIRPQVEENTPAVVGEIAAPADPAVEEKDATDMIIDAVKDKAEDMVKDEAKEKATSLLKAE